MSSPLFFTSSKVPTTPVLPGAGQLHATSSSGGIGVCEPPGPGLAVVTRGALAAGAGEDAAPAGGCATGCAAALADCTGRATTPSAAGGATRSTWPTSITFG